MSDSPKAADDPAYALEGRVRIDGRKASTWNKARPSFRWIGSVGKQLR